MYRKTVYTIAHTYSLCFEKTCEIQNKVSQILLTAQIRMHNVHIHGSKGKKNVGVHQEGCQQLSKKIYLALLPSPFPHVYRPVD